MVFQFYQGPTSRLARLITVPNQRVINLVINIICRISMGPFRSLTQQLPSLVLIDHSSPSSLINYAASSCYHRHPWLSLFFVILFSLPIFNYSWACVIDVHSIMASAASAFCVFFSPESSRNLVLVHLPSSFLYIYNFFLLGFSEPYMLLYP